MSTDTDRTDRVGRSPTGGVRYRINLPYETAAKVETLLLDDLKGKRKYGALGNLCTKLLNEYFAKLEATKSSYKPVGINNDE